MGYCIGYNLYTNAVWGESLQQFACRLYNISYQSFFSKFGRYRLNFRDRRIQVVLVVLIHSIALSLHGCQ